MTSLNVSPKSSPPSRAQRRRVGWTIRITPGGVLLIILINLVILAGWSYGLSRWMTAYNLPDKLTSYLTSATPSSTPSATLPPTSTSTRQPTASPSLQSTGTSSPVPPTASPQPVGTLDFNQGLIVLAMDEGGNTHLFAYQPEGAGAGQPVPLTRLTYGPWDDITPAISPDGRTVAFASNRSGYWDLYLLDVASGGVTRQTDSPEYKAAPAWSPDNKWLVYETYLNNNLEIMIKSVVTQEPPIQLTDNPSADFSPAWSPNGRQILFVSDRSGEDEIWLADLDKGEDQRYMNMSLNPTSQDTHPEWSPDGTSMVWVGAQDGMRSLFVKGLPSSGNEQATPTTVSQQILGSGDWPAWSVDGNVILTSLSAPNRTYLTAYSAHQSGLALPALELPGSIWGLSWGKVSLPSPLAVIYQPAAQLTVTPLFVPSLTAQPADNGGRFQLAHIDNVEAPHPFLNDQVDESFQALRSRIAAESGWDILSSLENAYVPLTSPLDPGMISDWLYTGRAIALSTLSMNADWLVVMREDFGADTYWRVYIRALYQDGSAGMPLHDLPWDFNARYLDTANYEQGGSLQKSIPTGYWIDFTERARSYGWERLPALSTWTASYPAARFNEFVAEDGLDWQAAMLELYPPEALITPTPMLLPTRTLTPTSRWYVSPTPTLTPTPRPTLTPFFQVTPTP